MTIRKKLFLAMAGMVAAMSLIFAGVTVFVVKQIVERVPIADRSEEIHVLSELYVSYFERNGGSWDGVAEDADVADYYEGHPDQSAMLLAPGGESIAHAGSVRPEEIRRLGIRHELSAGGEPIATLYYHDAEAANLAIIQLGVGSSVTVFSLASVFLIGLCALFAAWRISERLTRPLRSLMPIIERLGRGELGVQAPVEGKDEYGKLASAFNAMSGELERAEATRRSLTADIAHELRTPLAIVRGKLDYLQERGETVEPEQLLPLQDELIRLSRLVDDLHRVSLAEAKKLPLDIRAVDLPALLDRVAERAELEAESKGVRLTVEAADALPAAEVDPNRMTQVFLNLVMNALRHTPSGGTVAIRISADRPAGMLVVAVEDTGTGIAPEHLPFIFDRFYRADADRSRSGGGMGLGLAIAKAFVLAHGGTIEAESELGRGTRMIVSVPTAS